MSAEKSTPVSPGWRRTASELLHEGPFLKLYRDSVRLPDGSTGPYEHVAVEDSVRVVALDAGGGVILVEDDFYLQGRRVLHLPGGGSNGEDPHDAALRELEEETGLVPDEMQPLGVFDPLCAMTAARVHLFVARGLRLGAMNRDPAEAAMTVQRWELHDAVQAVFSGDITEAGSALALLLAGMNRK